MKKKWENINEVVKHTGIHTTMAAVNMLAALQKRERTPHFKCFALIGGSEISSVFNSVSCSHLRNFTVVTESYLAFYTGHQCIAKIPFIYNTAENESM